MRHRTIHVDPEIVAKSGIEVYRAEQKEGYLIVTFPRAYHSGYNSGLNVAEAANFAHPSWVEYGVKHRRCDCEDKYLFDYNVDVELLRRFVVCRFL